MSDQTFKLPEAARGKTVFGHPVGLFVLFFTEMWERFSFYGMRAILILFLVDTVSDTGIGGGLGIDKSTAQIIYGTYGFIVYLMSIPGGILADKYLGQKKSVLLGGVLLVIGPALLTAQGLFGGTMKEILFFLGLFVVTLGVGALKPNISTMVGGLYHPKDGKRDMAFTIFYIGINVGAFLAGIVVASVAKKHGWHFGFGIAGVGMFLGLIVYLLGQKYLKGVGEFEAKAKSTTKTAVQDAPLTAVEKDRMKVLLISFLIVVVFWGAFEQAGGLLNLYADEKVDRMVDASSIIGKLLIFFNGDAVVPAGWFQSVNAFYIMIFGTIVAGFWAKWAKWGKENSSLFKMGIGTIIMGFGFMFMVWAAQQYASVGYSSMSWLFGAYFFHTIGELCLSPVALSFITRLSPAKYGSRMMGIYFAVTGLGNMVAGVMGSFSEKLGEEQLFLFITAFAVVAGLLVLLFLKKLKKLTHGAEDNNPPSATEQLEDELDIQQ
ncbi:dipeptide/tripeptide permease [Fulvitalea axinellae]|uniref:Dipeptide/tripeptide permease n=1 Tax=Fulvitalea axinellae TaxID=1182444 RepID=A0AAU9CMG2_9BACT|nr:dipeptide/tripeptide permease [Fulvitalea axinellae]